MAVLEDLKVLRNIASTDNSKDALITLYIRKATTLIINYMNSTTITDATGFDDAVIEYVTICMNKKGNEGLKQFGQGSRSGTYEDSLPQSVKALLPVPYARMLGVYNVV